MFVANIDNLGNCCPRNIENLDCLNMNILYD